MRDLEGVSWYVSVVDVGKTRINQSKVENQVTHSITEEVGGDVGQRWLLDAPLFRKEFPLLNRG